MSISPTAESGEKLIELLTQQVVLYGQLDELAQQQSGLIDGGNPEMLLRVLGGRQRLIERLTRLNQQLQSYRENWQSLMDALPLAKRDEAQNLVTQVQEMLSGILARDERDSEQLRSQQKKVAGELRQASTGRKVNNAYGNATKAYQQQSRYFDVQSQ